MARTPINCKYEGCNGTMFAWAKSGRAVIFRCNKNQLHSWTRPKALRSTRTSHR